LDDARSTRSTHLETTGPSLEAFGQHKETPEIVNQRPINVDEALEVIDKGPLDDPRSTGRCKSESIRPSLRACG
jgi:hypothetical protein